MGCGGKPGPILRVRLCSSIMLLRRVLLSRDELLHSDHQLLRPGGRLLRCDFRVLSNQWLQYLRNVELLLDHGGLRTSTELLRNQQLLCVHGLLSDRVLFRMLDRVLWCRRVFDRELRHGRQSRPYSKNRRHPTAAPQPNRRGPRSSAASRQFDRHTFRKCGRAGGNDTDCPAGLVASRRGETGRTQLGMGADTLRSEACIAHGPSRELISRGTSFSGNDMPVLTGSFRWRGAPRPPAAELGASPPDEPDRVGS